MKPLKSMIRPLAAAWLSVAAAFGFITGAGAQFNNPGFVGGYSNIGNGLGVGIGQGSIVLSNPGSGYAVGDTVTLQCAGATFTTSPIIVVTAISGGTITGSQVTNSGFATVVPGGTCAFTQASTSGSGSGAVWSAIFGPYAAGISAPLLTTGGSAANNGNYFAGAETPNPAFRGSESVFIGDRAGGNIVNSNGFVVAVGHNACGIGAGVPLIIANSVCIGTDSQRNAGALASFNTSGGTNSLRNVNGLANTGWGNNTLQDLTTSNDSSAFGFTAGIHMTGSNNSFFGSKAGADATGGAAANLAVFGGSGCAALTSGGNNSCFGANVGPTLKTGTGVLLIGTSNATDVPSASTSNYINIANIITATGTNTPSTSILAVAGDLQLGSTFTAGLATATGYFTVRGKDGLLYKFNACLASSC